MKAYEICIFLGILIAGCTSRTRMSHRRQKRVRLTQDRNLEESEQFKLFDSAKDESHVTIGIFSMIVHKSMKDRIFKKLTGTGPKGAFKWQDLRYKQNLKADESQDDIHWNAERSSTLGNSMLQKIKYYSYYPTSYAKSFYGWHIFDYLIEKNGDPLVDGNDPILKKRINKVVKTVPINVNMSNRQLKKVLKRLDGIVLTGGSQPYFKNMHVDTLNKFLSNIQKIEKGDKVHPNDVIKRVKTKFFKKLSYVMKYARELNDDGKYLPVWTVCLGFEAMLLDDGDTHLRLSQFQDRNKSHGIRLRKTPTQSVNGSFAKFLHDHFCDREQDKYFFHYHIRGFTPDKFFSDPYLKNKYNILAVSDQNDFQKSRLLEADIFNKNFYNYAKKTQIQIDSKDRKLKKEERELIINRLVHYKSPFKSRTLTEETPNMQSLKTDLSTSTSEFVSIVENKKYPFYGLQFHPEKSNYDFHNNPHVQTDDKTRWNNELLLVFFLEKVLNGKINYLLKLRSF